MGIQLSAYASRPSFIQTVTLSGAKYRLRLSWNERTAGWYMGLRKLDGTGIIEGVRLSAGWCPLLGLSSADKPSGMFYVAGPKEYVRADLGVSLQLRYYELDELPSVASTLGVAVTL